MKKRIPLIVAVLALAVVIAIGLIDRYSPRYDAEYIGAAACGECHTQIYPEWQRSPHANMLRKPAPNSVVGDFDNASWTLPPAARRLPVDSEPAARMYAREGSWYMDLREPASDSFRTFRIDYVVGYQYRQVYLTREDGGVLRRLPLQWSVPRQEFFPYWNLQEKSTPTVPDLWAQMTSQNSAWNLFCARCHTTHLVINRKNANHTVADVEWADDGIACEACHGPGSLHAKYFESNYLNRISQWINSNLRGDPVAYIASAGKLNKGEAMSVCARCHGADIYMSGTDVYRSYEPGYSRTGHTNDLSAYFESAPLTPSRNIPTLETWSDGEPKGIGMLFRSLIESECYRQAEVRCYDCHNPHDNKQAAKPGLLFPSEASNDYCLGCHEDLRERVAEHTRHEPDSPGAYCYDCHMPKIITKLATGELELTRTHRMSLIPGAHDEWQPGNAPNACLSCHGLDAPAL
ncbi:MAG: hypothetical protein KJO31_05395 [Gammaproteobacteria bacterium]|nr:hypothetical protein [Gammaproteobacteria bacterium]